MRATLALLFGLAPSLCLAATFTVTRHDDPLPDACLPGDCSLREAAMAASAQADADTIVLAGGTYFVSRVDPTPGNDNEPDSGAIKLDHGNVSLIGLGSTATRIKWTEPNASGVVQIHRRLNTPARTVAVQGMVISHGTQGCLSTSSSTNDDQIELTDVIVESCTGRPALHVQNTDLTITDSIVRNNSIAQGGGAGIDILGSITILSSNLQVTGNVAAFGGGGVRIYGVIAIVQSHVTWVDDGRSLIANNQTNGSGGGIQVSGPASLQLATVSTAPSSQRMTIRDNVAVGLGGGIHVQTFQPASTNRLERLRIIGNSAASGGGIAALSHLQLVGSEIASNTATGNGGGVYFESEWSGRSLQQVALSGNQAGGGGGGIAADCSDFEVLNASFDGNRAASGRGQAIETEGQVLMRHATVRGNGTHNTPGIRKAYHTLCAADRIKIANSLITDNCSSVVTGGIQSEGGNQYGLRASACPALQTDRRQSDDSVFGLTLGAYGGAFNVWGWSTLSLLPPARPQRDFGLTANCTAVDVRGLPRIGRCDAGAFEQQ